MVIQVLNSKLGITLRVSVTSATIYNSYTKMFTIQHGLNHGIMIIVKMTALLRRVSSLLKGLIRRLRTMAQNFFLKIQVLNYV